MPNMNQIEESLFKAMDALEEHDILASNNIEIVD